MTFLCPTSCLLVTRIVMSKLLYLGLCFLNLDDPVSKLKEMDEKHFGFCDTNPGGECGNRDRCFLVCFVRFNR